MQLLVLLLIGFSSGCKYPRDVSMQPIIMEGPYPDAEENLKNRYRRPDPDRFLFGANRPQPPIYGPVVIRPDGTIISSPRGYPITPPRTTPRAPILQSPFRAPLGTLPRPFIAPPGTRPLVSSQKPGVVKPALPPPRPILQIRPGVGVPGRPLAPGAPPRPLAQSGAFKPSIPITPYKLGAPALGRPLAPGAGYRPSTRPHVLPRPSVPSAACNQCNQKLQFLLRMQHLKYLEEQDYFMMMHRYKLIKYYKRRLNRLWWWRRSPCYPLHGPHYHPRHYSQRRWWRNQAIYRGRYYGRPLNRYGRPIYPRRYSPAVWWRHPANLPKRPVARKIGFTPLPKKIGYHPIQPKHPVYTRRYLAFLRRNHPYLYHRYTRNCFHPLHRYRMRHYSPYYTPRWVRRYHYPRFGHPWFTHRTPIMYYGPRMRYKPYIYHPRRHPWVYYPYHQYFPPSYYYY